MPIRFLSPCCAKAAEVGPPLHSVHNPCCAKGTEVGPPPCPCCIVASMAASTSATASANGMPPKSLLTIDCDPTSNTSIDISFMRGAMRLDFTSLIHRPRVRELQVHAVPGRRLLLALLALGLRGGRRRRRRIVRADWVGDGNPVVDNVVAVVVGHPGAKHPAPFLLPVGRHGGEGSSGAGAVGLSQSHSGPTMGSTPLARFGQAQPSCTASRGPASPLAVGGVLFQLN